MNRVKRIFIGLAVLAAVLSLRVEVQRDYDGNISLTGLTSEDARAAVTEGKAQAIGCYKDGQAQAYAVHTVCDATSTQQCNPSDCPL